MKTEEGNKGANSLSEQIIEDGDKSFKLWLEFEETTPWNNLKNDFANISVDTLDGRKYGINIWTYEFLNAVQKKGITKGSSNYIIPPDLFVKELTRDCIEKTIKDLLSQGNLEKKLNESIFNLNFLTPYLDAIEMEENTIQSLMNEFRLELSDHHILSKKKVELIARKSNNDDIILEFDGGRIAVVHLTWSSKEEIDGYPISRIYKDKMEFWNKEMKKDIFEFKE